MFMEVKVVNTILSTIITILDPIQIKMFYQELQIHFVPMIFLMVNGLLMETMRMDLLKQLSIIGKE